MENNYIYTHTHVRCVCVSVWLVDDYAQDK